MPQIKSNGYNISYPPLTGQYAYYDSRTKEHGLNNYLIKVDGYVNQVACHYSLSFKKNPEPFVTCQGIILEIVKEINLS